MIYQKIFEIMNTQQKKLSQVKQVPQVENPKKLDVERFQRIISKALSVIDKIDLTISHISEVYAQLTANIVDCNTKLADITASCAAPLIKRGGAR